MQIKLVARGAQQLQGSLVDATTVYPRQRDGDSTVFWNVPPEAGYYHTWGTITPLHDLATAPAYDRYVLQNDTLLEPLAENPKMHLTEKISAGAWGGDKDAANPGTFKDFSFEILSSV